MAWDISNTYPALEGGEGAVANPAMRAFLMWGRVRHACCCSYCQIGLCVKYTRSTKPIVSSLLYFKDVAAPDVAFTTPL